jgi:hypothetical protein
VTHHGSLDTAVAVIVVPIATVTEESHADTGSPERYAHELARGQPAEPRCAFCGCVLALFARLGWLRSSA